MGGVLTNLVKLEMNECFNYVGNHLMQTQEKLIKKGAKPRIFKMKLVNTATCKLCKKMVRNVNFTMKEHSSVHHLKIETNVKNLFTCLLCPKGGKSFNGRSIIYTHVKYSHCVPKPMVNEHYLDNTEMYKSDLNALYKKCFPEFNICVK